MLKLSGDKLKRVGLITDLFNLFENFGNQNGRGLTMVINGKYGSGKSTLLNFIEEKNEQEEKFNILKYNAWENNFFENPLIPILHTISKLKTNGAKIKDGAKNILKNIPKVFFATLANAHSLDLQALCSNENIFEEYDSYSNAMSEFKNILKDHCTIKKTILFVDELDRCLPEYQIKVLESIYHLLDIPDLIVVIALDKTQLENAIKSKFGEDQNTYGYLAKFIQYEIDLPEGDTYEYIKQLMTFSVQKEYEYETKSLISDMFKVNNVSIRECQLMINEINMICNECGKDGKQLIWLYWYPILIALLTMMKKLAPNVFKKYFGVMKERVNNYSNTLTSLNSTDYGEFLKDIENTAIKQILKVLLNNNYGQCFMLHFINTFYPIRKIALESLSSYIGRDGDTIQSITNSYGDKMAYYPEMINGVIEKLKILK